MSSPLIRLLFFTPLPTALTQVMEKGDRPVDFHRITHPLSDLPPITATSTTTALISYHHYPYALS